jgi:hypothetical protein
MFPDHGENRTERFFANYERAEIDAANKLKQLLRSFTSDFAPHMRFQTGQIERKAVSPLFRLFPES